MESDQAELLKIITSLLNKYKIPYMITGAWSVIYYGRPRASHDIDFVVDLKLENVEKVLQAFQTLSPDFSFDKDAIKEAVNNKNIFQILHLPTLLKFDCWLLKDDSFDISRFSRRRKVRLLGQYMYIASMEDTILQKLRWYKEAHIEKHIVDAAFVYQVQKRNLDNKYLKNWIEILEIEKYFKEMKRVDLEKYL
jgi:hypothetical protein